MNMPLNLNFDLVNADKYSKETHHGNALVKSYVPKALQKKDKMD